MWDTSTTLLTALAAFFGFLGIYLAGRAVDLGFAIFGGALVVFAVVYIVTTINRVYGKS